MTMPATHSSLFYDGPRQYAAEVGGFLREGLEQGHRGLVMAPAATGRPAALRARPRRRRGDLRRGHGRLRAAVERLPRAARLRGHGARRPDCVIAEQTLAARTPGRAGRLPAPRGGHQRRLRRGRRRPPVPLRRGHAARAPARHRHAHPRRAARRRRDCRRNARFDDPFDMLAGLAAVVPAAARRHHHRLLVAGRRRRRAPAGARPRRRAWGSTRDVVDDVALAVTEVLTNALLHGEPPALLHIYESEAHLGLPRARRRPRPARPARRPAPAGHAVGPRLRPVAGAAALHRRRRRQRPDRHARPAPHAYAPPPPESELR